MSKLTIYETLKPEIKEALHSPDNDKYETSIKAIVAKRFQALHFIVT